MAKATATCTCATCGKEFTVSTIKQNRREADSWEDWARRNYDECKDCRAARAEAERKAENEKAAAAASEAGLPVLQGSERQVAWATTIRQKVVDEWLSLIEQSEGQLAEHEAKKGEPCPREREMIEVAKAAYEYFIGDKLSASWWIDNRDLHISRFVEIYRRDLSSGKIQIPQEESEEEKLTREAARAEVTATPENQTHDGVAEIIVSEDAISTEYVKNDEFRAIVKGLGYQWNSDLRRWMMKLGSTTGPGPERAAELGNKLLNAGFAISIADPDTLRAAIEGHYRPRTERWITKPYGKAVFYIQWGRSDDLYREAKSLPGARYERPGVTVPTKQWQQVLDFAEMYDFRLSPAAEKAVEEAKAATMIVAPAPAKQPEYNEVDVSIVLESGSDVIEDLKDDSED